MQCRKVIKWLKGMNGMKGMKERQGKHEYEMKGN